MPDVLVVGALPQELHRLPLAYVTGVGKVNAAAGLSRVFASGVEHLPQVVLNLGSCGALDDSLSVGQLVSVSATLEHDASSVKVVSDASRVPYSPELYLSRFSEQAGLREVRCATSDTFVADEESRKRVLDGFQAQIVDMEAYAYARVCQMWNISFTSVKVVSDAPGAGVKDWREQLPMVADTLASFWESCATMSR